MIITCPHCQTKYQVTYEAIGSAGRKVQCAHCQQAWQQTPLDKEPPASPAENKASEAFSEDSLDEAVEAEERKVAAAAKPDTVENDKAKTKDKPKTKSKPKKPESVKSEAGLAKQRQKDFFRRQSAIVAGLPMARLRRTLRISGGLLLAGVMSVGYFQRTAVVERFPAMAGLYESVGLGVNVVGLDFSDVTTLQSLRDGKDVLSVSAQIVGLAPRPVPVPAVVVTLLDSHGQGVYEWSVSPAVSDLMAGERATFNTQLTMPPGDASRVRLSFAGGPSLPVQNAAEAPADAHGASAAAAPGHGEAEGHSPAAADPHAEPTAHGAAEAPAEAAAHAEPAAHGEPAAHDAADTHAETSAPPAGAETTDHTTPEHH